MQGKTEKDLGKINACFLLKYSQTDSADFLDEMVTFDCTHTREASDGSELVPISNW
jgi:hypothetical protein